MNPLDPSEFDSPSLRALKAAAREKLALLPADPVERARILGSKADFFAAQALWIRPKDPESGLSPFVYNPIQMDYLAGLRQRFRLHHGVDVFRGVRDIILKPRQLGFTTFLASLFFLDGLFNPGRNCLVLTHLDKVSQKVLDIYRAFYDSLPDDLKKNVRLRRASALHLELEFLDENGHPDPVRMPPSSFIVHTAAGFDLRGITVHNLHCSEAAFYDNWLELVRGVFQAVPTSGNIVLESTANGFNHYKDLVDGALKGSGVWRLVFYPWFAHPEYSIDLSPKEAVALEASLDAEERTLKLERGVSLCSLAWRRAKIDEMSGSIDSFRQEYPSTILDAFLSSGRPVFPPRLVAENWDLAKNAPGPERRDDVTSIWAAPDPAGIYVLSADPAEGIDKGEGDHAAEIGGTDYSSASLRDARTLRTVATIHGRMEPAEFARRCAALGHEYNDALIVVERNNHGHLVLFVLEEASYPNLYRHQEYDAAGQSFLKLGFPMNVATRPLVIDTLREVVARGAMADPDPDFWKEALVFIYNPAGKAEAMPLRHDDRVMDRAIGTYICTLGAKAWGASGVLRGADDAGFPVARPGSPAADAAPAVVPFSADAGEGLDAFDSPVPPHKAFMMIADMRSAQAERGAPNCGNCHYLTSKNGVSLCGMQGFTVKPEDPPCPVWEAKDGGYNDEGPPHRVFIGGENV
jgi:hypothetical protein